MISLFRQLIGAACILLFLLGLPIVPALAGEADIVDVKVTETSANTYRFDVTVAHGDTGWDHYANMYEVLDMDGNILGTRVLMHPHVNEQPFTRSLSGVHIPNDLNLIIVRATDSVHGTGGREISLRRLDGPWQIVE